MGRYVVCGTLWPIFLAGCLPALPENTKTPLPEHLTVSETAGAALRAEPGMKGAYWLEVPYLDGSGSIGGYLSSAQSRRPAIVILLHGATSFNDGRLASARGFYENAGEPFREAGFRTLSLAYTECGTSYGQADLDDLLRVVDWLNTGGGVAIGVDRIYLFGYSTGGTLVNLAARIGGVTAGVSIAGLTEPDVLERSWGLYNLLGSLYPENEGMCQAATTVNTYGLPGSPGWDVLDTVAHVNEIKMPLLAIQGTADQIYDISNNISLELAYQEAVATNASALPTLEFIRLDGVDHFYCMDDPRIIPSALEFFGRFGG